MLYRLSLILVLFSNGLLPAQAQQHEMFKGFVILQPAGGGLAFYDTDVETANPDFTNVVVSITEGQSLRAGGEATTDRDTFSVLEEYLAGTGGIVSIPDESTSTQHNYRVRVRRP